MKWLANAAEVETSLLISGSIPIPSFRVELGLTDASADSLNNHVTTTRKKEFKAAVEAGDERRWVYTSNWKEWPAEITIKDNRRGDGNVGGLYSKIHVFCICVLNVIRCVLNISNEYTSSSSSTQLSQGWLQAHIQPKRLLDKKKDK